ncbi:MAG: anti-sigma factor [Bacteroidota bacterium]
MDVKEYIASGILELYVAGILSEKEKREVDGQAREHPEIQAEIQAIARLMVRMTRKDPPDMPEIDWAKITPVKNDTLAFQPGPPTQKKAWTRYLGWVATLLFGTALLWVYVENRQLRSDVEHTHQQKGTLEQQLIEEREALTNTNNLLEELRAQNVTVVPLRGQSVAPESFAKVYWNTTSQSVYIDALGLPEPPKGYTYQVWSLLLHPFTPSNIGRLENFSTNQERLFQLPNPHVSEAFGITLEPEGGSNSTTLEQLYTLGAVEP